MPEPIEKVSQVASFNGTPVEPCKWFDLPQDQPTPLDVETVWELEICTDYTKRINWLHIGQVTKEEILFDLQSPSAGVYELVSYAMVELGDDVDVDPANNHAESPSLFIEIVEEGK